MESCGQCHIFLLVFSPDKTSLLVTGTHTITHMRLKYRVPPKSSSYGISQSLQHLTITDAHISLQVSPKSSSLPTFHLWYLVVTVKSFYLYCYLTYKMIHKVLVRSLGNHSSFYNILFYILWSLWSPSICLAT